MNASIHESRLPGYLSLFASLGTLVCCAFPAMLVVIGLGATVASALPWLVTLSKHKDWVFAISGVMIAANAYYVHGLAPRLIARRAACPPGDEQACAAASRLSRVLLLASVGIYMVGFFVAYALGPLLTALDR